MDLIINLGLSMKFQISLLLLVGWIYGFAQPGPHTKAHAHNDYEHARPLFDALANRFNSVEADVHLKNGLLLVAHNRATGSSPELERLYFKPLDSLLKVNKGSIYAGSKSTFFLMIDIKTDDAKTYHAIRALLSAYPALKCMDLNCAVKIFLSGNRPIALMMGEGYDGLAIDGRPADLGKGYSKEWMPVISDAFSKWSGWDGKSTASGNDLRRIKELAVKVHAEGKLLRLWAMPDNILAWRELSNAGVDLINTDHLVELNNYLTQRGY